MIDANDAQGLSGKPLAPASGERGWGEGVRSGRASFIRRLLEIVSSGVEGLLSGRGLAIAFFAAAASLTASGWLRPPLSADLAGIHLPLRWAQGGPSPEEILYGPRQFLPASLGGLLLMLIAACLVAVCWRPRWFAAAAGLLLCGAMAAAAAAAFNYPALIELMDLEYEQRQQIVRVLNTSTAEKQLVNLRNGRIPVGTGNPEEEEQRADPIRGWVYSLYGWWLIPWAAVGILLNTKGPLLRRLTCVAKWAGFGLVAAIVACGPRLCAEYHWERAEELESRGDYAAARRTLETALGLFPEFERLERTWLLAGKLDHLQGHDTAQQRFFQAYQLARDQERPRAFASSEDLPWLITGSTDPREGMETVFSSTHLIEALHAPGAPVTKRATSALQGRYVVPYQRNQNKERHRAIALMEDLLAEVGRDQPAVCHQTARFWTAAGLRYHLFQPIETDLEYSWKAERLLAAAEAWRRAAELSPRKRDTALYLGIIQARIDQVHPELVEAELAPILNGLADRVLEAEILATLGDAYLNAGQLTEARRLYARSYDVFSLPKRVNHHAQRMLGGL